MGVARLSGRLWGNGIPHSPGRGGVSVPTAKKSKTPPRAERYKPVAELVTIRPKPSPSHPNSGEFGYGFDFVSSSTAIARINPKTAIKAQAPVWKGSPEVVRAPALKPATPSPPMMPAAMSKPW